MLILGIACAGYGYIQNNSVEAQLSSLLSTGTTNPGTTYIVIGVVVAVIGALACGWSLYKKHGKKNSNTENQGYSIPLEQKNDTLSHESGVEHGQEKDTENNLDQADVEKEKEENLTAGPQLPEVDESSGLNQPSGEVKQKKVFKISRKMCILGGVAVIAVIGIAVLARRLLENTQPLWTTMNRVNMIWRWRKPRPLTPLGPAIKKRRNCVLISSKHGWMRSSAVMKETKNTPKSLATSKEKCQTWILTRKFESGMTRQLKHTRLPYCKKQMIWKMQEIMVEQLYQVGKAEILETVAKCEESKEYDVAIQFISDRIGDYENDSQVVLAYNRCKDAFRDATVQEAKNAYTNEGFQAALSIVNNALMTMEDDAELQTLAEYYRNLAPVRLSNLESYRGDSFDYDEVVTDCFGTEHSDNTVNSGSETYRISGKYTILKGTFLACIGGDYNKKVEIRVGLKCWGDGVLLCDFCGYFWRDRFENRNE